ncbi:MAG: hypothetical protein NC200_04110 [Candidatus Gastranaerophilales bacterium]|nr:hypothetical protein [Candidatus Gastranaerophilales bacterium]
MISFSRKVSLGSGLKAVKKKLNIPDDAVRLQTKPGILEYKLDNGDIYSFHHSAYGVSIQRKLTDIKKAPIGEIENINIYRTKTDLTPTIREYSRSVAAYRYIESQPINGKKPEFNYGLAPCDIGYYGKSKCIRK